MKHKKRNIILILVFLISLITLFWYSFVFEPNNIQVEKINIKIENLPEEFEGTKIVHLTDFHSKNFGEREKKVLEILDDINPDFVFITGDFIDHKTKDIDSCQEFWRELGNKYQGKIFGVLGNHEYWNNDAGSEFLKSLLNESGVVVLDNKNEKIFQGDEYIYLIGVGDPHTGNDNLEKAVTGVEKDIPKILLAHSPDIVNNSEDIEKEKVDLILVGHTHGGQVKIPFLRPFWTPTENRGKYASGLFEINDTYLYVNRGIGTTVLPIRFNCSLEVTMIELRKK
ncbi:MAG: metallophosphoesterase [Candidatus Pacebacteria bacterium]|nr:metallophosphoesterase [Candidatus Paceibacterota bacterium]